MCSCLGLLFPVPTHLIELPAYIIMCTCCPLPIAPLPTLPDPPHQLLATLLLATYVATHSCLAIIVFHTTAVYAGCSLTKVK